MKIGWIFGDFVFFTYGWFKIFEFGEIDNNATETQAKTSVATKFTVNF